MPLLTEEKVLLTEVARVDSIAFAVADQSQRLGTDVALAVFSGDLPVGT